MYGDEIEFGISAIYYLIKSLFCKHESYECAYLLDEGEHSLICKYECTEICTNCRMFKKS